MKYTVDESLTNFKFWSGAEDRAKNLTYSELEQLDDVLPEYLSGGDELPSDTDINDMFWFDFPTVCHAIGLGCYGDDPMRDPSDFPEKLRIEVLTEYANDQGWKFTDDQLKALDAKCLDEGVFEIEFNDDSGSDDTEVEDTCDDLEDTRDDGCEGEDVDELDDDVEFVGQCATRDAEFVTELV